MSSRDNLGIFQNPQFLILNSQFLIEVIMLKSTLLQLIRTFSKAELIKFEDFIRSPYFNKKESVVTMFLEIKKYAPDLIDANLEKEKIWVKMFPGMKYNYGILKNIIHELTKLCESFITIEHTKSDKLHDSIALLEALLARKVTRVFSSKIEMIEKVYDNSDLKNESFSIERYYDFLNKLYYLKSVYNRHYNIGSTAAYEFTCRSIDYLIYSAVIKFYKYFNNYSAHAHSKIPDKDSVVKMFHASLNENLILPLLMNVKDKSEKDYIILKCFYEMNTALADDAGIPVYSNFKKSIHDCLEIIPKQDLKDLLTCLTNSLRAIGRDKSGSSINFNKEIVGNYDLKIENEIFLESNGILEGNSYLIYAISAFELKEYESIEILAKKFADKIPEYRRDNDNNFIMALICYGKKEYSKSLEHLSKIKFDFFNMKFHVKFIQMMNYYELDDYLSFNYFVDSYRHFLSNNKSVPSHVKSVSEDLCNNMNKLFKLRESFDKFELEIFRKKIQESKVINKDWILEKISEIEKNN